MKSREYNILSGKLPALRQGKKKKIIKLLLEGNWQVNLRQHLFSRSEKIKHANLGCCHSKESLWENLCVEEEMDAQNVHFHPSNPFLSKASLLKLLSTYNSVKLRGRQLALKFFSWPVQKHICRNKPAEQRAAPPRLCLYLKACNKTSPRINSSKHSIRRRKVFTAPRPLAEA